MLIHAATYHGVRGVGVTLSEPQAELARERIREAGLSKSLKVRVADYRAIRDGLFDKVVSIGMYEHVGASELGRYASTVRRLLRPGGLFLNYGIAPLMSTASRGDTFISRYILPGGELHPVSTIRSRFVAGRPTSRRIAPRRSRQPETNASGPGASTCSAQPRLLKPARSPSTRFWLRATALPMTFRCNAGGCDRMSRP